jgi:hypothetical protein
LFAKSEIYVGRQIARISIFRLNLILDVSEFASGAVTSRQSVISRSTFFEIKTIDSNK